MAEQFRLLVGTWVISGTFSLKSLSHIGLSFQFTIYLFIIFSLHLIDFVTRSCYVVNATLKLAILPLHTRPSAKIIVINAS